VDDSTLDTERTVKDAQIARSPSGYAKETKPRISRRMGGDAYEHVCRIYFIEAVGMDLIKIGYTIDPVKRFMTMLTVSPAPLSLLGSIWGGPRREAEIHGKLEAHRLHGEWFKKVPEVMAYVEASEQSYGDKLLNQVARQRGAALQEYLAKMKAGEVVRPTKGKHKRPKSLNPRNLPYEASTPRPLPLRTNKM
jgi:hypothetical protein